ncbi:MAG: homoserine/homoserine lactone efflux protein [Gammaproteobacteria bacterium]|nr:homoserine/homoserine lactone efflux protein [Gammaproteobacteria bacterium]
MNLDIWLAWCLACIVISITPGAGAINTMSNGIQYGVRHSLPAIMGQQLGLAVQFIIVGIGLGSLLASSTSLFDIVKWLGVLYLVFLGIQKWQQPFIPLKEANSCELEYKRRFWQSTFVNLSNPKATIFLVALLPQFLDLERQQFTQFSLMMFTSLVIDIIVMLGYATLATTLVLWMKSKKYQRRLNHLFGGLFIVAAGLMASFQRQ